MPAHQRAVITDVKAELRSSRAPRDRPEGPGPVSLWGGRRVPRPHALLVSAALRLSPSVPNR